MQNRLSQQVPIENAELSANCDSPSLYHFFNYFHIWWKCHSIAQDKGLTKSGCGGRMEVSTLI